MNKLLIIVLLIVFNSFELTKCAKILGMCMSTTESECRFQQVLLEALADREHLVTYVSHLKYTPKSQHLNVVYINDGRLDLASDTLRHHPFSSEIKKSFLQSTDNNTVVIPNDIEDIRDVQITAEYLETSKKFNELREELFDLFILLWNKNEYLLGMATEFNCPSIIMYPGRPNAELDAIIRNSNGTRNIEKPGLLYAFNPVIVIKEIIDELHIVWSAIANFITPDKQEVLFKKVFWHKQMINNNYEILPLSFDDAKDSVKMIMYHEHFKNISEMNHKTKKIDMIDLTGITVLEKPRLEHHDIKLFLENRRNGVILFALGDTKGIPKEKVDMFAEAFKLLDYNILVEWNDIVNGMKFPIISDNILVKYKMPIKDLLTYSDLKVFITNCDTLRIAEAQYFAKPILCIPLYQSQLENGKILPPNFYGVIMKYHDLEKVKFYLEILRLLFHSEYMSASVQKKKEIGNQPDTTLEFGIASVNKVLNTKYRTCYKTSNFNNLLRHLNAMVTVGCILLISKFYKKVINIIKEKISKNLHPTTILTDEDPVTSIDEDPTSIDEDPTSTDDNTIKLKDLSREQMDKMFNPMTDSDGKSTISYDTDHESAVSFNPGTSTGKANNEATIKISDTKEVLSVILKTLVCLTDIIKDNVTMPEDSLNKLQTITELSAKINGNVHKTSERNEIDEQIDKHITKNPDSSDGKSITDIETLETNKVTDDKLIQTSFHDMEMPEKPSELLKIKSLTDTNKKKDELILNGNDTMTLESSSNQNNKVQNVENLETSEKQTPVISEASITDINSKTNESIGIGNDSGTTEIQNFSNENKTLETIGDPSSISETSTTLLTDNQYNNKETITKSNESETDSETATASELDSDEQKLNSSSQSNKSIQIENDENSNETSDTGNANTVQLNNSNSDSDVVAAELDTKGISSDSSSDETQRINSKNQPNE